MRRLAVVACAFGLLLALPVLAGAKVIDVPVTTEFRSGNTDKENCQAFVLAQWPAQANAEKWELEYLYNGKYPKKVNVIPPFHDLSPTARGWEPPAGHHWFQVIGSAHSTPGKDVECASSEGVLLGLISAAVIHITIPDPAEEDEIEKKEAEEKERKERKERERMEREEKKNEPPTKKGAAKCRGKTPTIFVKPGAPTNGTARRDVIMGTPKRDVIRARGGNDLICGLGGNDMILGGNGNDVVLGQGGGDTLHGQAGRDTVLGGAGADHIFGEAAADRLFGQAGADALNGGAGRPDLCDGGPGRDQRRSPGCERRQQIP